MTSPIDDLNKYLQSKKMFTSLSWLDEQSGPKHEAVWTSTCKIDGVEMGTGSDRTKRRARTTAAKEALAALEAQDANAAAS